MENVAKDLDGAGVGIRSDSTPPGKGWPCSGFAGWTLLNKRIIKTHCPVPTAIGCPKKTEPEQRVRKHHCLDIHYESLRRYCTTKVASLPALSKVVTSPPTISTTRPRVPVPKQVTVRRLRVGVPSALTPSPSPISLALTKHDDLFPFRAAVTRFQLFARSHNSGCKVWRSPLITNY